MADQQTCAEKLFLLGEMLSTASQYLAQCEQAADRDDQQMLELAESELISIRAQCATLCQDLKCFGLKLKNGGTRAKSKSA
jgi:hypothetical protein